MSTIEVGKWDKVDVTFGVPPHIVVGFAGCKTLSPYKESDGSKEATDYLTVDLTGSPSDGMFVRPFGDFGPGTYNLSRCPVEDNGTVLMKVRGRKGLKISVRGSADTIVGDDGNATLEVSLLPWIGRLPIFEISKDISRAAKMGDYKVKVTTAFGSDSNTSTIKVMFPDVVMEEYPKSTSGYSLRERVTTKVDRLVKMFLAGVVAGRSSTGASSTNAREGTALYVNDHGKMVHRLGETVALGEFSRYGIVNHSELLSLPNCGNYVSSSGRRGYVTHSRLVLVVDAFSNDGKKLGQKKFVGKGNSCPSSIYLEASEIGTSKVERPDEAEVLEWIASR